MKLPKISIVIPSYNKVNYVGETLESIVSQEYPNLEVIINDGGSTDGTLKVIKKYASKYAYITFKSGKDGGQLNAISDGLEKSTGNIVTYINADDVYERGALMKVGEFFLKNPKTLWLAGKGKVIDKDSHEITKIVTYYKNFLLSLNTYYMLLATNYLMQPSVFLTRKAYQKYGPFTGTKVSVMEYEMWLKFGKIEMPEILNEPLSSFRLTDSALSVGAFEKILNEDLNIAKKYTRNILIIALHHLHNLGRIIVLKLSGI